MRFAIQLDGVDKIEAWLFPQTACPAPQLQSDSAGQLAGIQAFELVAGAESR